jgi:soluble cytochrome b562
MIKSAQIKSGVLHLEFNNGLPPMQTHLNITDNELRNAMLMLLGKDANIDRVLDEGELEAINTVAKKLDDIPARAMEFSKLSFIKKVKLLFKRV